MASSKRQICKKQNKKTVPPVVGCFLTMKQKAFLFIFHIINATCVHACMPSEFSHVWFCVNPWTHSPPGSSVHELLQARMLEWVAIPFSRKCVCVFVMELGLDSTCNFVDCFLHLNWSSQTTLHSLEYFLKALQTPKLILSSHPPNSADKWSTV